MQAAIAGCALALPLLGLASQARAQATNSTAPTLQRAPGASAGQPSALPPGQQTAAELDREAAAQRAAEQARQPEVARGLRLPDESGVWALDAFEGTPELVRVRQSDGDLNLDTGHSVRAMPIPQGGARDLIRLMGDRAVVELHQRRPVFYVALDVPDEPASPGAMVMHSDAAERAMADRTEQSRAASRYVLVRLRTGGGRRAASAQQLARLSNGGEADGDAEVIGMQQTVLPGGRWMRVTTRADVGEGQYSLVEMLSGSRWNADDWDFGVQPGAPENKGARLPKEE